MSSEANVTMTPPAVTGPGKGSRPAHIQDAIQRILDAEARRRLAEELDH